VSAHRARLTISTRSRTTTVDVTSGVREAVRASGVADGICVVSTRHTTTGVFLNENADPAVQRDLLSHLDALVPRSGAFQHAEGNADAHIKSVLVGSSVTLPVQDGDIDLGTWQGVYLAEFDGPRERHLIVTVVGS